MGGEVFEWNLDINELYVDQCTDCAYVTGTKPYRSTHGGSFHDDDTYLASQYRWYSSVPSRAADVGFRCARAP
jgi:formylglycine-generating enzyme required for sulfatase activity